MSATELQALPPSRLRRLRRPAAARAGSPWRQPTLIAGLVIAGLWILVAIFAPLLEPHDPLAQDFAITQAPSGAHPFGTDDLGRDILSRVIAGARQSLPLAVLMVVVSGTVGTVLGIIAGYLRGWVDGLIMRLADLFSSFPAIVLAMVVTASLGPSTRNAVLALVLVTWPIYARVVRSLVLSISTAEYVQAYRLHGASAWRAMRKEVLPNIAGPVIVLVTIYLADALLLLAGLSFLGLGTQPPTPEWGSMVSVGTQYFQNWWMATFPGLAIFTAALAFNLIGDGLRDVFDPADERAEERLMALLDVEGLSISLPTPEGRRTIVHDVDLSVEAGQIYGIAGESGSGKTMTMLALLGLLPRGGEVTGHARLDGRDLAASPDVRRAMRGKDVAMVFQDPMTSLHPMLTVGRQLTEHARVHLGLGRKEAQARAAAMLEEVRIPDGAAALKAYPHEFSGGMRQRIAIAIALMCEPRILIADEPTTALDVTVQAGILQLLDRLRREKDMAVVLITHDLGVMSAVAERMSVMYAGRVIEAGTAEQILQRPGHPYTRALLASLPQPGEAGQGELSSIPGTPAIPADPPPGCAFHPRCPLAEESCRTAVPPLIWDGAHGVACPITMRSEVAR